MASTNGDGDDLFHHEANTKAFIQSADLGVGDLYIRKSYVQWKSSFDSKVLHLDYKRIALHAVSRDGASFSMPCLYCMVDGVVSPSTGGAAEAVAAASSSRGMTVVDTGDERGESAAAADSEEEMEDDESSEVRFAPEEPDHLDIMYGAMSKGQLFHPDTDDEEDGHQLGEGGESILQRDVGSMEGFFTDPADVVNLTPEGLRVLEHLNAVAVEAPAEGEGGEEGAVGHAEGQFENA